MPNSTVIASSECTVFKHVDQLSVLWTFYFWLLTFSQADVFKLTEESFFMLLFLNASILYVAVLRFSNQAGLKLCRIYLLCIQCVWLVGNHMTRNNDNNRNWAIFFFIFCRLRNGTYQFMMEIELHLEGRDVKTLTLEFEDFFNDQAPQLADIVKSETLPCKLFQVPPWVV